MSTASAHRGRAPCDSAVREAFKEGVLGMIELFAAQVAHTPDADAVVFEDERARASWRITCAGLGVGPEVVVGLCIERSL